MKTILINGQQVPQFEHNHDNENILKWANQKLREHFAQRTCIGCKYFCDNPVLGCGKLKFSFLLTDTNQDQFSCAAFQAKDEV